MRNLCDIRLDKSFRTAPVLALTPHSRIVLISDCHRGVGNSNDNFLKNQHLYFAALQSYYKLGFTYIELGDGDEFGRTAVLLPSAKFTATSSGFSPCLPMKIDCISSMAITIMC